jgi:hypothetical protein
MASSQDPQERKVHHPGFNSPARAKERRAKILELVTEGLTIGEALDRVGISRSAYEKSRKEHPEFAAAIDAVRGRPRGGWAPKQTGTFTEFRQTYFGYYTFPHQARIINEIERAKPGEVVLILVPPEWGKTTLLEDYCNYRIARDPNVRITLVSEGQPHARKILRRVQKRMVDRMIAPNYVADYGPFHVARGEAMGKPWSADYFTVFKADHDERDYTMEARGWRSAIAGTRTDLLLVDDMQSARSLNQTEKMVETFRQDMLTRPGKSGRVIIVGTRVGVGDFYEEIQNQGIVDRTVILAATDADGNSNCEEMWSTEALKKRRAQVGDDVWWRTYMQQPRLAGTATFTHDMTEDAKDLSRTIGTTSPGEYVIMGLDPALVNWNALFVAGCTAESFAMIDGRRDKGLGSTEAILAKVDFLASQHHPHILVVEGNAYQRGLANDQRLRDLGRLHGFRVVEHQTGQNKMDEFLGVARMPTSFVKGEIIFPWGDEPSQALVGQLIEEMHLWRPDKKAKIIRQDFLMAMWFCWLEWQRLRAHLTVDAIPWNRGRLPWAPTGNPFRARSSA